jgi:hypothetical protein
MFGPWVAILRNGYLPILTVVLKASEARVEALGVRYLLGAPTTMWVLVGASPTGSTSKGQPDVGDSKPVICGRI